MILVDANLLIYAHSRFTRQHEAARAWLDEKLNGDRRVGLPWPSLLAFQRILSTPRAVSQPSSAVELWRQVEAWLSLENVWTPVPQERHAQILRSLLPLANSHALIPDAHLAALAIEYNLTLCSTDGDFARFPGLRWENPLSVLEQPR